MTIKDKLMSATGVATLLHNLGITAEDTKKAGEMLVDFEIGKATHAESLSASEQVKDRWDEGQMHRTPTAEEIHTGPPQHASGGGVDKMISTYSPNKAPQDGTVVTPERLAEHLGHFHSYAKSTNDAIRTLSKGQETLTQVLTAFLTTKAAEEVGGEPGEAARFGQTFASKADQFLRAAKTTLSKSRQLRDSLDEVDGSERKAIKAQIRDMRKRAARLILKSLAASYAAKSDEADPAEAVRKSIHTMLEDDAVLKADMSALNDKDKDKDEEKKTKKAIKRAAKKAAAKAAAKAAKKAGTTAPAPAAAEAQKGDDKGHQADKQDPENKNQAAHSKGLNEDVLEQVNKALSGQAMLEGNVNEIMDLLRGKPLGKQAAEPLELMKGEPQQMFMALDNRITEGVASGRLDPAAEMKARDLLQKSTAVRSGIMPIDAWNDLVAQSPTVVKQIFAQAA